MSAKPKDVTEAGGLGGGYTEPMEAPPDPNAPKPPPPKLAAVLGGALDRMDARAERREGPIVTPWRDYNEALPGGGLWAGMHVLVAGTGTGKSTWALQLALHAAEAGSPVAYVGLELDETQIALRLVGERAKLGWSNLYTGGASDSQRAHAREAARELEALPFHLEHGSPGGWSATDLASLAERMRGAYPASALPMLLVVDFLQIVGAEPNVGRQELRERIGRAAYVARQIARTHDAAVLLVSSVARDKYDASALLESAKLGADLAGDTIAERFMRNPDAIVGVGKESGEIEYAADSVTVALRCSAPEVPKAEAARTGATRTVFAVPKLRAGRPSWCELRFNGHRFHDAPDGGRALAEHLAEKPKLGGEPKRDAKPKHNASEGIEVP